MLWTAVLLTSCLKLLLIPSYHSTDFEVHRNWLAITHNLPINRWYYEDTSEWTLDYPPLFAWFEYLLSHIAKHFDPKMLDVHNLNYASKATVVFQRLSVIVTDLLFVYGSSKCCTALQRGWRTSTVLPLLLIPNAGLLMVDHIHFQYNGIMFGLLLLSIADILQERFLRGALLFALLLNMKHIYIYIAPAYFVYLLKNFCFSKSNKTGQVVWDSFCVERFLKLGLIVAAVFTVTFIPFYNQLEQVFSRMFPFKRGLCHAYWAPNWWALYNVVDKALGVVCKRIGHNVTASTAAMTGGLVQEFSHVVLPSVTPIHTMVLTVLAMLPSLNKLWWSKMQPLDFVRCVVLCALTSFLFGWHVHEKAILMAVIPLSILAIVEAADARTFLLLSTIGHYSLFPLLYPQSLLFVKILIFLIYSVYCFYSLSCVYPLSLKRFTLPLLNSMESIYILGFTPLCIYDQFIHPLLGLDKLLPFLPLMMTSAYCAIGVVYCWLQYCFSFSQRNYAKVKKIH